MRPIVGICEIAERLHIGPQRAKELVLNLGVDPILPGRRPLYLWAKIESELGAPGAEKILEEPPKPVVEPTRRVGGAFTLTENENAHFTDAAAQMGVTKMGLLKNLLLDFLTKSRAEKMNGAAGPAVNVF